MLKSVRRYVRVTKVTILLVLSLLSILARLGLNNVVFWPGLSPAERGIPVILVQSRVKKSRKV